MLLSFILIFLLYIEIHSFNERVNGTEFIIAVHGGAGSYNRSEISIEKEIIIKQGIFNALKAGFSEFKQGHSSLEATKAAIITFEDNPHFNAGKGGKITQNFEVELDASIMDGSNLKCGAVAGVKHIKNPIKAAEMVMMKTPHILLACDSADLFAKENNLEIVENTYFFTKERIDEWIKEHDKRRNYTETKQFSPSMTLKTPSINLKNDFSIDEDYKTKSIQFSDYSMNLEFLKSVKNKVDLKGTTGAVALDMYRHLAAATSTGGTTYKMSGRIGDTPLIGAGNYANDKSIAISCTGTGEEMIRRSTAFDLHARMTYKQIGILDAAKEVMAEFDDDTGGFIAIDKNGKVVMPYNTSGMARGYVTDNGKAYIAIFSEGSDLTPNYYDISKDFELQQ